MHVVHDAIRFNRQDVQLGYSVSDKTCMEKMSEIDRY